MGDIPFPFSTIMSEGVGQCHLPIEMEFDHLLPFYGFKEGPTEAVLPLG
jgi:hypothetical protein